MFNCSKATHITLKFHKLSNYSKSIHRLSAQLLGRSFKAPLTTTTPEQLPLLFDKAFNDKLSANLSALPIPTLCPTPITFLVFLDSFDSPTLDRIISLLNSTSSTSYFDHLPLSILKQITHNVASPFHIIICT